MNNEAPLSACNHCGAGCNWEWIDDGVSCWGEIETVDVVDSDEGTWIVHACKAHAELWFGGQYVPKTAQQIDVEA